MQSDVVDQRALKHTAVHMNSSMVDMGRAGSSARWQAKLGTLQSLEWTGHVCGAECG